MPAGLNPYSAEGYAAFAAIKFGGYVLAGTYLNREFFESQRNILLVGLVRTIIGIAFGISLGMLAFWYFDTAFVVFMFGLAPIRVLEWFILIRIFYPKEARDLPQMAGVIIACVIWSFVLDVPAIIGFLATGGLWIC